MARRRQVGSHQHCPRCQAVITVPSELDVQQRTSQLASVGEYNLAPPPPDNISDPATRIAVTCQCCGATVSAAGVNFGELMSCPECGGSGAAPGAKVESCRACGGTGQQRLQQGFFVLTRPCTRCDGAGRIPSRPCPACEGTGTVRREDEIPISVPAGIESGQTVVLEGRGEAGPLGLPPGNLVLRVIVREHPVYKRDGDDIHIVLPVAFPRAALGGTVRVPTLWGEVELRLKPGTQPGQTYRLRGKGIARRDYGQGDQYVHIDIDVPAELTPRQRELLEELDRTLESGGGARAHDGPVRERKGLFEKLREKLGG
jgi:molecular chaperone DnaJ